jgi:hypothetical protein
MGVADGALILGIVAMVLAALAVGLVLGRPGPAGPAGAQGPPGTPGSTGPAGRNGTNGVNGTNGANGANGTNGLNGTNGTNGANGTNGTPGPGAVIEQALVDRPSMVNLSGCAPQAGAVLKFPPEGNGNVVLTASVTLEFGHTAGTTDQVDLFILDANNSSACSGASQQVVVSSALPSGLYSLEASLVEVFGVSGPVAPHYYLFGQLISSLSGDTASYTTTTMVGVYYPM